MSKHHPDIRTRSLSRVRIALSAGLICAFAVSAAQSQGIVGGAADGASAGRRAAGPVGGVVGGVVGGAVGGAVGGVRGVLGLPRRRHLPGSPRYRRHHPHR